MDYATCLSATWRRTTTAKRDDFHSKSLFLVKKKDNGTQKAVQRQRMGILVCEQHFRGVWRRNKSVRAEIGKILRTHTRGSISSKDDTIAKTMNPRRPIETHSHEEADTLIPIHLILRNEERIYREVDVWSPDTDLIVLLMDPVSRGHLGALTTLKLLTGKVSYLHVNR